jgi:aldehyde dehydrogenase (NAD+)
MQMDVHQSYIAGRWLASSATLPVINPSDGSKMAEIARGGASEVDAAVAAGQAAVAGQWGKTDAVSRGRLLLKLAELIRRDSEKLAKMESEDVGKPMTLARGDVAICARYFEYYGAAADKVHGDTIPFQNGFSVMTFYEPHGVTAHIVPWNYPLQMTGRSVAPSLAMGNAIVLKPAEDTSLTALSLAKLAEEAGFPPGVFDVVTGLGDEAGAALSAHLGIGHVSFTGSREVGVLIQTAAAKNTIPVTLETAESLPRSSFRTQTLETPVPRSSKESRKMQARHAAPARAFLSRTTLITNSPPSWRNASLRCAWGLRARTSTLVQWSMRRSERGSSDI